jgi:hypothetical protein
MGDHFIPILDVHFLLRVNSRLNIHKYTKIHLFHKVLRPFPDAGKELAYHPDPAVRTKNLAFRI